MVLCCEARTLTTERRTTQTRKDSGERANFPLDTLAYLWYNMTVKVYSIA